MTEYTRKQVLDEAKELATMLANTEEIERFKKVEAAVNSNQKVKQLISHIKTLQKQAVNYQAYEKTEALKRVDAEIERLQAEIDTIPVVQEFKESQVVVNDVLQHVTKTIAREVTNIIIKDKDDDILQGKIDGEFRA